MCKNAVDTEWLVKAEKRHTIFGDIDYNIFNSERFDDYPILQDASSLKEAFLVVIDNMYQLSKRMLSGCRKSPNVTASKRLNMGTPVGRSTLMDTSGKFSHIKGCFNGNRRVLHYPR